jgi:Rrf2 family protein
MLALSKKTDYALIALAYLVGHEGRTVSAREIAEAASLPLPLLMQILKTLHQHRILDSTRGARGGYRLAAALESLSLRRVVEILDGLEDVGDRPECDLPLPASKSPIAMLQRRLLRFLEDVKICDLVRPGRRIDVPVESVRFPERAALTETRLRVCEDQVQPVG